MAAHRYWRLSIYETIGGPTFDQPELWRIKLRESVGGADIEDIFGDGEAFDSNLDDVYVATANGSLPETVTADLGSTVAGVADVVEYTVEASNGNAALKRIALEFSDDNVAYTKLTEYSDLSWSGTEEKVFLSGNPSTPVEEPAIDATIWRPVITLDGVDVSDNVTGTVTVEAEENTARIASFLFNPDAGVIDASSWLNKAVTIDYKTVDGDGVLIAQDRLFTGVVDYAVFNRQQGIVKIESTDDLQGQIEAKTQSEIDALITNSFWSEAVFGEYKNGWLYLENLLETYPQSFDLNVDGVTGALVDWAAKTTADFTYGPDSILSNSIDYKITPRRDIFNQHIINYSYRFKRLKHREHTFKWQNLGFCAYFAKSHELPTKEMISAAADGIGWQIKRPILYGSLPSTSLVCNGAGTFVISEADREQLAITATFDASKRWDQLVTENYVMTINAPQSVSWLGQITFEESASNETELDSTGWADSSEQPTGRTDSLGDIVQDMYDRTVSDNDLETLMSRAGTEILSSHRSNKVTADIELNPQLERFHTVRLDADGVVGQGKVSKYIHNMDIDNGSAITEVTIAVSLNGGAAVISDTGFLVPTAPNTDPSISPPAVSTSLPSRIGNDDGVPDFDSSWIGFTGNYSAQYGTPSVNQLYPRAFRITSPDINQEAIDAIEAESSEQYNVNIPNETLTVTVS